MLVGPASMDWHWIFFNNRDKSSIGFFFFGGAKTKGTVLGGGNSHVFFLMFIPNFGEMIQF